MKIERINANRPTAMELRTAYENGILTDEEFESKSAEFAALDIADVTWELCLVNEWEELFAVSKTEFMHGCLNDLFDFIVDKDLSYLARVDSKPSIIRTDDGAVFTLYTENELLKKINS